MHTTFDMLYYINSTSFSVANSCVSPFKRCMSSALHRWVVLYPFLANIKGVYTPAGPLVMKIPACGHRIPLFGHFLRNAYTELLPLVGLPSCRGGYTPFWPKRGGYTRFWPPPYYKQIITSTKSSQSDMCANKEGTRICSPQNCHFHFPVECTQNKTYYIDTCVICPVSWGIPRYNNISHLGQMQCAMCYAMLY